MTALAAARRYDWREVQRARVALVRAMHRAGYRSADVVNALQSRYGVSRSTAFRALNRARSQSKEV